MEKVELSKDQRNSMSFETDRTNGLISWPQRNYKCSFCKKQFKSAQALGGHMNIHRRDRAKLRFSTSWDSDFPKQNPNPNFSSNPNFSPYLSHYSSSSMASFSSQSQHEEKVVFPAVIPQSESDGNTLNMGGPVGGLNLGRGNETRVWKRRESAAWMEHEMGHVSSDAKEDLDLELRLGCP